MVSKGVVAAGGERAVVDEDEDPEDVPLEGAVQGDVALEDVALEDVALEDVTRSPLKHRKIHRKIPMKVRLPRPSRRLGVKPGGGGGGTEEVRVQQPKVRMSTKQTKESMKRVSSRRIKRARKRVKLLRVLLR
mmetsp:Transcript_14323/g.34920  ORF Transcript_14323/g.34920 Transcript_14323/m.34920 type:complete len:133 (-) Transcript_14323:242-640(-)